MPPRKDAFSILDAHQHMKAEWAAAQSSRFKRVRSTSSAVDADWHIRNQNHYFAIMELARSFERDSPLVRQGVRRLVAHVNPGAMQPAPATGVEEINDYLKAKWSNWGKDPQQCDSRRRWTFPTLTNVGWGRSILDGDIFARPDDRTGRVRVTEGHRCRSSAWAKSQEVCGVELDADGAPLRYTFSKSNHSATTALKNDDLQAVDAFRRDGRPLVWHLYNPERFSQSRGITHLAPVSDVDGRRDDIEFATLVSAQVQSCVTFFEQIELGANASKQGGSALGPEISDLWPDGSSRTKIGIQPGLALKGSPGKRWELATPNIPAGGFFELEKLLLTYLAINLDLPLMSLLLDAERANFSTYRNIMDDARQVFREHQRNCASLWHTPIYRWKVSQWSDANSPHADKTLIALIAKHGVSPEQLQLVDWLPIGWAYIQPLHDTQANVLGLANGTMLPEQFVANRYGMSWDQFVRRFVANRKQQIEQAHAAATDLTEKGVRDVSWRDLMPIPMGQGTTLTVTDEAPPDSPGNKPKQEAA